MKTAKITEIWKFRKWEWPHGDVFYIPLTLDNWENITLGKKKEDAFKVWDTVNYEENGEWKWKEVKVNNFQPKAFSQETQNKWAMIWLAFKLAFEHLYDKTNYNETYNLAVRIYEDAMALFNGSENKSEWLNDTTENDDLPF